MTRKETGFAQSTEFSRWLRALPKPLNSQFIDVNNLDFIWFNYREGWLITIEEKRYGAIPSSAQIDSLGIIRQLLELSSGKIVRTMRGARSIEYRGHYFIIFENTTPKDSQWIRINNHTFEGDKIKTAIYNLLRYGKL